MYKWGWFKTFAKAGEVSPGAKFGNFHLVMLLQSRQKSDLWEPFAQQGQVQKRILGVIYEYVYLSASINVPTNIGEREDVLVV